MIFRECRALIDPAAMAAWHSTVHAMRVAIGAWLSKASKHAMVAYPLLTQLLCLDSEDAFLQGAAPLLDGLQKQLKVNAFYVIHTFRNYFCLRMRLT